MDRALPPIFPAAAASDENAMAACGVRPSVLVVEDGEPEHALERRLSHFGYQVHTAAGGDEALLALPAVDPDLVLLEVTLPGSDGCEMLARIRSRTDAPVIMLSVHDSEADRVRGLLGGADDYLPRTVSPMEITARVAAVLRRSPRLDAHSEPVDDGVVRIESGSPDVLVRGELVRLTPIEYRLLEAFIDHAGHVLSPEQLGHLVWGRLAPSAAENARLYVGYLRAKIERDSVRPELIETVRGRGYRYTAARMAPGGIEPPRAASKAAALSAELRGLATEA
jgi:two-component system KDP operon response regulator KdpE